MGRCAKCCCISGAAWCTRSVRTKHIVHVGCVGGLLRQLKPSKASALVGAMQRWYMGLLANRLNAERLAYPSSSMPTLSTSSSP